MKKAMAELDNEFIRLQQEISSKESIDISLDNIENIVKPTNEHHDRYIYIYIIYIYIYIYLIL